MYQKTFHATLHSPLFYSSSEGTEIRTSKILSSTALTHALGYDFGELEKRYALTGDEAVNPDYSYLNDLSLVVTDMKPLSSNVSEKTFRTTDYRSERNLTLMEGNNYKIPKYLSNTRAAWHTIRNYVGIEPGAEYEFTVWSEEPLPDELRFRMGIKKTGEFTAKATGNPEKVIMNLYMLKNVYNLSQEKMENLINSDIEFERGNDPRLQHLKKMPLNRARKVVSDIL